MDAVQNTHFRGICRKVYEGTRSKALGILAISGKFHALPWNPLVAKIV
jgi:hypothetical protein